MKKQLDEMEHNIKLQSQSVGFKAALLLLAFWTIYDNVISFIGKHDKSGIPGLLLVVLCVIQYIYEQAAKHRMIEGDEEYREPNQVMRFMIISLIVVAILVSIGSLLLHFS